MDLQLFNWRWKCFYQFSRSGNNFTYHMLYPKEMPILQLNWKLTTTKKTLKDVTILSSLFTEDPDFKTQERISFTFLMFHFQETSRYRATT